MAKEKVTEMSTTKTTNSFLKRLGQLFFHLKNEQGDQSIRCSTKLQSDQTEDDNVKSNAAMSSRRRPKLFSRGKQCEIEISAPEVEQIRPSSVLSTFTPSKLMLASRRRLRAVLGAVSDGHLDNRNNGGQSKVISNLLVNSLSIDLDMSPLATECVGRSTLRSGDSTGAIKANEVTREAGSAQHAASHAAVQSGLLNGEDTAEAAAAAAAPSAQTQTQTQTQQYKQQKQQQQVQWQQQHHHLHHHQVVLNPSPTLLTLSALAPAAMQRDVWSISDYEIKRRIYRGTYSSVYQATCLFSLHTVALKVYYISRVPENALYMLAREIDIHSELDHPNIIKLYAAFKEDDRLVLVQEFAPRRDLYTVLHRGRTTNPMSNEQVRGLVMVPLLDALGYLHSKAICHRDIKPENIFFGVDWDLKLGDFGVSINMMEERAVTRAGTMDYMAPEVQRCPMKIRPEDNKNNPYLPYSTSVDIWAIGILTYELLVGFPPVTTTNMKSAAATAAASGSNSANTLALHQQQRHTEAPGVAPAVVAAAAGVTSNSGGRNNGHREFSGELSSPSSQSLAAISSFPSFVSHLARDFIGTALAIDPDARPTTRELSMHPWVLRQHESPPAASAAAAAAQDT